MSAEQDHPRLRVSIFSALGNLVVASLPPGSVLGVLGLVCCLPLVLLTFERAPSTAQVWCSTVAGACSAEKDGQVRVRVSLGDVDHFEAFAFRQNKGWVTELRAVTPAGNVLLAGGWPLREFEAAAEGLNEVLAGASGMRSFAHDDPGTTLGDRWMLVAFSALLLVMTWPASGPCWLVIDRDGGAATLLWPFRPRRWRAAQLAGVQFWSAWNEASERALRTGQMVPYSLTLGDRAWLVLVDHAGRRHRATRAVGDSLGHAELKVAVARVAERLRIQALPPVEPRPPGHVPPRPPAPVAGTGR